LVHGGRRRLAHGANEVAEVTLARYPDLNIPFHSRWRTSRRAGVDRAIGLDAHAMVDLAVVSVLLDAGAGPDWHYDEAGSALRFTRSEGLGVASWHAFAAGLFSSDRAHRRQADAAGLRQLDADRLADAFQVGPSNPMVGLDGRVFRAAPARPMRSPTNPSLAKVAQVACSTCSPRPTARCPHPTSSPWCWVVLANMAADNVIDDHRLVTAGVTKRYPARASRQGGCRSTSCRNG